MKRNIRAIAALLSMLMLITAFAGCSKNDSSSGSKDGKKTIELDGAQKKWASMFGEDYVAERAEYEKANPPYNVPDELKGTTVKFATWIDHTKTEAKYPMANFSKVTGINVEWVEIPSSGYIEKIASMVAAGDAPDVYVENNQTYPTTLTLSTPLNKVKSIDMKDPIWDKGFFDFTTFGGNTYQCNTRNSVWQTVYLYFYNKKVYDENGLKTPADYMEEGTWNYENYVNSVRSFKELGGSFTGGTLTPEALSLMYGSAIVYMKDGHFVSGLKDEALKTGYSRYLSLVDDGLMGGAEAAVMKGTAAGIITDSYGLKNSGYFAGIDAETLGYATIPVDDDADTKVASHYRAYGIVKGAKNAEGAGYFLRFFLDPYNYNWDEIFLDESAKEFYLKNCADIKFENKSFAFHRSMTRLMGYTGYDGIYKWDSILKTANSNQLNTALDSISNEVNSSIKKANELIDSLS